MIIRCIGLVNVFDRSGNEIVDPAVLKSLDRLSYDEEKFTDDLGGSEEEDALADLLEEGGVLKFEFDEESSRLRCVTEYVAGKKLTKKQSDALARYTQGQWSDGIGENFASLSSERVGYSVQCGTIVLVERLKSEATAGPKRTKSALFSAAERGDVAAIREAIARRDDLNERHRSVTPLCIALANDHAAVALLLIEAGADVNLDSPIVTCASAVQDDETSLRIAEELAARGADMKAKSSTDHSALEFARHRGKTRLEAYLMQFYKYVRKSRGDEPNVT